MWLCCVTRQLLHHLQSVPSARTLEFWGANHGSNGPRADKPGDSPLGADSGQECYAETQGLHTQEEQDWGCCLEPQPTLIG